MRRIRIVLAFAAIYMLWGSTYLAIRYGIESIPPFLMAGTRFLLSGTLLYLSARLLGAGRPAKGHWRSAAVLGALLLAGSNGAVVWAEQRIASGVAALINGLEPLFIVILDAALGRSPKPGEQLIVGLALGFGGLLVLLTPAIPIAGRPIDALGAVVVLGGSLSWAVGSVYSRAAHLPQSIAQGAEMQMLAGAGFLMFAGTVSGEWTRLSFGAVTSRSLTAFAYLVIAGIVAFVAFHWLLRTVPLAWVATHAYVNPVVAVMLGWAIAEEPMTLRTLTATALVITAVALITTARPGAPHHLSKGRRA